MQFAVFVVACLLCAVDARRIDAQGEKDDRSSQNSAISPVKMLAFGLLGQGAPESGFSMPGGMPRAPRPQVSSHQHAGSASVRAGPAVMGMSQKLQDLGLTDADAEPLAVEAARTIGTEMEGKFKDLMRYAAAVGPLSRQGEGEIKEEAMDLRRQLYAGALALTVALSPPAAIAADIANGAQVFAGNCAACHAGGQNVIQAEKTLQKEALEEYLAGGLKEESIIYQVKNGKNAMPAFGGRLGEDEIQNVAAYVYDQATNNKWE